MKAIPTLMIMVTISLFEAGAILNAYAQKGAVPAEVGAHLTPIKINQRTVMLSEASLKSLERLKKSTPIYFPEVYTERFSSVTVKVLPFEGSKEETAKRPLDYQIEFCNKKNGLHFSVESASDGIGDSPDGSRTLQVHSKVFGAFQIDVFPPHTEGNDTKNIYYISQWLEMPRPGTKKVNSKQFAYHLLGNGLTDKEAVAVTESLKLFSNSNCLVTQIDWLSKDRQHGRLSD